MYRYLYTRHPKFSLPGRYNEVVKESCLLHSRAIGEFFFDNEKNNDDIRISHYYNELISKKELEEEIGKTKSKWDGIKKRINKNLGHLTFTRNTGNRMSLGELDVLHFEVLIELFGNNLPIEFREKWRFGKSFSK